jgi:hypothetical protein
MLFCSSNFRWVMKAGGWALLWLLWASTATAAPAHHRRQKPRVCDPRARLTLRVLSAHRPPAGPVSVPSTRARAGLADPMLLFQRGSGTAFADDIAAISNDVPAARIDADASLVPAFEPLGVLGRTVDRLPRIHSFSPRSPRGPPFFA